MARGKRCCLAVPVLANIHRGLNEIVSSKTPSKCDATFPTHYLNAWLAEYFDTHFELEGSHSKAAPRMFRYSGEGASKHYDEVIARKLFHAVSSFKFHRLVAFDPIHMPSRDVTQNKSIMCSLSIPTTSTITKFEPNDLILKANRQHAKTLGGDLIEKVIKTPFTLMTSLRDGV